LEGHKEKIKSYQKINLVLPEDEYFYYQTINGFQQFCQENNLEYCLLDGINPEDVIANEMYFVLNDDELFQIIKIAQLRHLDLGYDIGILSFNDKPFKAFLWQGISSIKMNFDEIAIHLMNSIMENEVSTPLDLSLQLIDRSSF
jgi:DNA-binding LacI/PurR family transcriptional regulator